MQHLTEKFQKYTLAFLCSSFIVLLFLVLNHEIYLPLGKNLSDYSSDGIKNLYTFAYYLKYDSGLSFTGLLYPFAEHPIYMDAQPFWVWCIQFLESIFGFQVENPIVYVHAILLFNLWLGSGFIYLILNHYNSNKYFSFIGSIIIMLMSPQVFRFASHYALGSIAVIPMFWWWYICISQNAKIWKSILFSISLSLTGYIHPYLLLMVTFLLFSYEFISTLIDRKLSVWKWIFALLPLILFQVSIKVMDPVTDRPISAWGAKEFASKINDLLLPLNGVIKNYFVERISGLTTSYTEGHGYITIFGILVLVLLFYSLVIRVSQKKFSFSIEKGSITHWLIASIPVLMFAFFIPFRWSFMSWLLDILSPLKQFRGTGRFVVVFYYVFTVFSVVYLEKQYRKNPKIYFLPLIFCFCISIYDITQNSAVLKRDFRNYGKPDAYQHFKNHADQLFSKVENMEEYQCIIPFPPSTEGTEVMWLDADWNAKIQYFWYSYFYHLPLATAHSSRVSFSKNMEILQLSGSTHSPKPILDRFDPNKKCLVLALDQHQYEQIPLIKNANWIHTIDGLALYSISVDELRSSYTLERNNDWIDTMQYNLLAKNTFSKENHEQLEIARSQSNIEMLKFSNPDITKENTVRVLFWYVPNHQKDATIPIISAFDISSGEKIFFKDWRENGTQTYNYRGKWFCVDYNLTIPAGVKEISLDISSKNILVDDVSVYQKF